VAVGESLYTTEQFLEYLRADAVDVLQPDVARVGGITPWLRIAALAQAWNRPIAPHFLSELSVHLLCAIPNGLILENVTGGSLAELGLVRSSVTIKDGFAVPSSSPGHAIEFDRNALAASLIQPGQLAATDTSSSVAVINR
jgi:L-alanine-DL-glutamate epimerase-like enolase superfamily enzyme